MSKQIWKWTFEAMPGEELMNLARIANMKVDGFRQVNLKNPLLRGKLISNMLQKIGPLALRLNTEWEDNPLTLESRDASVEELQNRVREGVDPVLVLQHLLTSPQTEHHEKAQLLFDNLQQTGDLVRDKQEEQPKQETESPEDWKKKYEDVLKKLKKSEDKNEELKTQNQELEEKKARLESEVTAWKKQIEKQAKAHEDTVSVQELDKAKAAFEEERRAANLERATVQVKLREAQTQLSKLAEEHQEAIEAQKREWNQERAEWERKLREAMRMAAGGHAAPEAAATAATLETFEETATPTVESLSKKSGKQVALVGKASKVHADLAKRAGCDVRLIEPDRWDEDEEQQVLREAEEIWVLLYDLSIIMQKKIRKQFGDERLTKFNSFIELKRHAYGS